MSDNRKIRRRQRCPECGLTRRHQMGSPEWETKVKMQELQIAVFGAEEGDLEIQPGFLGSGNGCQVE